MLLTVNIGNSNIRFGLFKKKFNNLKCNYSWIISSSYHRSLDEYTLLFMNIYKKNNILLKKIKYIVIGSVVPSLTRIIIQSLKKIYKIDPFIVNRYSTSSVKHYSHQLGTDLYANAVASNEIYKRTTTLIIDFGTALSLTCIDKNGVIKGIIIAPGINSSLISLVGNTSQLPKIKLKKPLTVLGNYTELCIQSGIIYGYLSMIEGLIDKVNQEIGIKCFVIATGGLSHIYAPLTRKIHINDKLHTIKGLKILFHFNYKKKL
ncbi:type III pantothenate kinase [Blattabacterium cuenoti]|uniref:type III pantothenate kinase n=1 Tax=Blattabacterium cuenoti TaxID=1653831 RepID=UPI00163BD294|nr:type III pantothenate kinase [Blattabacterium cuenoti]